MILYKRQEGGIVEKTEIRISFGAFPNKQINQDELRQTIKSLASKHGLSDQDFTVEAEKPFPVDGSILILLTLASQIAYDVWKEFILPELKERYRVHQEENRKAK
jgi:hypothetical protein